MTSFERQVRAYARKIRLRAIERRELRERVLSYMEYHPVLEKPLSQTTTRESFSYISLTARFVRPMLGVFAVFLVVGVSSYAAESAVPGDVLYPVKVRVNEEVRSQLSRSGYEKVAWETERVERRIAEARLLAREGKLTTATAAALSEDVREHTEAAQKEIDVLRESDVDGAAIAQITFESALDVQSAVLETDDARASSTEGENSVRSLANVVKLARTELSEREVRTRIQSPISYEIFMSRIISERNRAGELFAAIDIAVSADERAEVEERLTDIDTKIAAVQTAHEATSTASTTAVQAGDVIGELRTIFSKLQKLIVFMTDIDVRTAVDIDTLIPEDFTEAEQRLSIELALGNLVQARDVIIVRAEESGDVELQDKITAGIVEFDSLLEVAASALAEDELDAAQTYVTDAAALMGDLTILTDNITETGTGTSTATTTQEQATTTESE